MKKGLLVWGVLFLVLITCVTIVVAADYTINSPYTAYATHVGDSIIFNITATPNSAVELLSDYGAWNSGDDISNDLVYYSPNIGENTEVLYNLTAMPIKDDSEGLVLLYRFDNRSEYGEILNVDNSHAVHDYSSSGYDGVTAVVNDFLPNLNDGKFGYGLGFEGIDNQQLSFLNPLFNSSNISFSFWTKLNEFTSNKTFFATSAIGPPFLYPARSIYEVVSSDGVLYAAYHMIGGGYCNTTANLSDYFDVDEWNHISMTYVNSTKNISLYIGGEIINSSVCSNAVNYSTTGSYRLGLGYSPNTISEGAWHSTWRFNGTLDEFAVWNRTLNVSEILDIAKLKVSNYGWTLNVSNNSGSDSFQGAVRVFESSICNVTGQYPNGTDCAYIGDRFITSTTDGTLQPYWIELPADFNSSLTYPLIINLHARGGAAYSMALASSDFKNNISSQGWIYIAPHVRGPYSWGYSVAQSDIMDTINDVKTLYNINSSRIHLEGGSMGGTASIAFTKTYPNVIASIFARKPCINYTQIYYEKSEYQEEIENLLGGSPVEVPDAYNNISSIGNEIYFKDTPVKLFHSTIDDQLNVTHSRVFNATMTALGYIIDFIENTTATSHYTNLVLGHEQEVLDFFNTYPLEDRSAPYVTLQTTNASSQSGESATLICNSFDLYNTSNVTLYGNWSGSWAAVETNSSGIDEADYTFTADISSSGTYNWNCYACDNLNQCDFAEDNYTLDFTYVAPAATEEEETTTPQPSGGSPSYSVGSSALQDGYSKSIGRSWRLRFSVGDEAHQLRLNSIDAVNQTVNITVMSTPQTRMLPVDEEWKVNFDGDNYYDLLVLVENVTSIRANVFIQEISEQIVADVVQEASDEVVGGVEVVKESNRLIIISEIILILVLITGAFLIGRKYLKNNKKKK